MQNLFLLLLLPSLPPSLSLTGAGKTYTMLGTNQDHGIMVLTLNDLFHKINETQEDKIYRVTMSYLEVKPCSSIE